MRNRAEMHEAKNKGKGYNRGCNPSPYLIFTDLPFSHGRTVEEIITVFGLAFSFYHKCRTTNFWEYSDSILPFHSLIKGCANCTFPKEICGMFVRLLFNEILIRF